MLAERTRTAASWRITKRALRFCVALLRQNELSDQDDALHGCWNHQHNLDDAGLAAMGTGKTMTDTVPQTAIRDRLRDLNTKAYFLLVALSFVYRTNSATWSPETGLCFDRYCCCRSSAPRTSL